MELRIRHIPADPDSGPTDHYAIDLSSLVGDITLNDLASTTPQVTAGGQLADLCREVRLAGRWYLTKVSCSGITCYVAGVHAQDYGDIDAKVVEILVRYLNQAVEIKSAPSSTALRRSTGDYYLLGSQGNTNGGE